MSLECSSMKTRRPTCESLKYSFYRDKEVDAYVCKSRGLYGGDREVVDV